MSAGHYKVALPAGTDVGGFVLQRVLGHGGFGITYMAENFRKDQFAVKEYLPNQFAVRDGLEVHPNSENSREDFEWGRERFFKEAEMLARFKHPNIVQVEHFFKENNTAYIVMAYEDGEPLDELLRRRGALTEAQLVRVLLPIADGLAEVHRQGVWHRDIKPGNVFVRRSDESPVLLDFGAARNALGVKSKSMEAIVSPPYSPPEQYYSEGQLGPYTDIYALSALCYRAIVGELPPESLLRQRRVYEGKGDPLPRLVEEQPRGYANALLAAVDWGLQLEEQERPQSVEEWLAATQEHHPSAAAIPEESNDRPVDEAAEQGDHRAAGSTETERPPTETEQPQQAGVFRKLVRGQYGLANTYWRFGVFGGIGFGIIHGLASAWDGSGIAGLGVLLVHFAYQILVSIGVWRAANAYQGLAFWHILARIAVVLGLSASSVLLPVRVMEVLDEYEWGKAEEESQPQPPSPEPPVGAVTFTLDNQSDVTIQRVYAGPDYEHQWDEDLLGSTVLPPGNQRQFHMEADAGHCVFDIRVLWSNGLWRSFMGRDLCEDADVVFDGGLGFIVSNESQTTIGVVQASSGSEESWGPDRLREDELIAPGAERVFMLEQRYSGSCIFDIALRTMESNVEYRDRDLCDDPKVVFHEGNKLTVLNEGPLTVRFVRLSPDHDSQGWGPDLLGNEVLPSGEELAVRLHQYSEDECLFDVRIVDADEQQHLYEQVDVCKTEPLVHPQARQPLTVRTGPPNARVEIVNIRPRYRPGIALRPGSYDVRVTARGFDKVERTLRHGDDPTDVWIGLPFRDCPICPKMVEIPPGSYTMGTTRGPDRFANEGPARVVAIQYPIAVGVFEVSFEEWDACRRDGGCGRHIPDEGRGRGKLPVANATVNDAKKYTNWLTARTGRTYRLLSEAEWEYAARAGTPSERHWDSVEYQCAHENGADAAAQRERNDWTGVADCNDEHVYAAPSDEARFLPNPWGLYHMLGNVSEWTDDCWHPNYMDAPIDGSSWKLGCQPGHVARGGSWFHRPRAVRAPTRLSYDPEAGRADLGFRVAVQIDR